MFRPAKHHDVPLSNGLNMHVLEWEAQTATAPTLICVHGLLRRASDFADFAAMNPDVRIIAPDVRGRGDSDWGAIKDYTIPQYVADMMDMLTALNIKNPMWLGTSMGGLIGMTLAAKYPDIISKLVLNDVGPHIPAKALRRVHGYSKYYPTFVNFDQARSLYGKVYAPFNLTSDQLDVLTQTSIREIDTGYAPHYDPSIGETFRGYPIFPFTMWRAFRKIVAPMLVIRGEDSDILLPRTVKAMHRMAKAPIQSYVEPDVGHAPMLYKAKTIQVIRTFLGLPVT